MAKKKEEEMEEIDYWEMKAKEYLGLCWAIVVIAGILLIFLSYFAITSDSDKLRLASAM